MKRKKPNKKPHGWRNSGHPWRQKCPTEKLQYRLQDEAEMAAKLASPDHRAYRCRLCSGWHLTSKPER